MVARVLKSGGLRDWMLQRLSAVVVAAYTLCVVGFWFMHPQAGFTQWQHFLNLASMRFFSSITVLALLPHAWIGMWTVVTDYIPAEIGQRLAQVVILLVLAGYAVWGFQLIY